MEHGQVRLDRYEYVTVLDRFPKMVSKARVKTET